MALFIAFFHCWFFGSHNQPACSRYLHDLLTTSHSQKYMFTKSLPVTSS
jgi:hypothetical protein